MHELLTAAEMAEADRRTVAGGMPGMTLMEAAGRAVAEAVATLAPEGPVLVVAGPGNNGGDGFVTARRLLAGGRDVRVALFGEPDRLRGDARVAFERWPGEVLPPAGGLPEAAVVVDALFGAGLTRPLDGPAAALVEAMNRAPKLLAVDLPSGIDADTGAARGAAVRANATVTFFRKKPGHLLYPGRGACGRLTVADIGIDPAVLDAIAPRTAPVSASMPLGRSTASTFGARLIASTRAAAGPSSGRARPAPNSASTTSAASGRPSPA